MFLTTKLWTSPDPSGNYRVVPSDLEGHIPWMASINSRLPPGSNYTIELGHNGNGNIGICNCCVLPCLNETFIHPKGSIDTTFNTATVSSLFTSQRNNDLQSKYSDLIYRVFQHPRKKIETEIDMSVQWE
jgi:hypothetical protein